MKNSQYTLDFERKKFAIDCLVDLPDNMVDLPDVMSCHVDLPDNMVDLPDVMSCDTMNN